MADEYAAVKRGKLILKGDKPKAKKRKHKKNKDQTDGSKVDEDSIKHGGWWKVEKIEDVVGSISIEFGNNAYISALDNGLFTIGAPHNDGDGPSPEEIFTAFPAGETKFALKSGYGKYLGVSKDGVVIGRSDAVGAMEQWEPVWQEGKTAILSSLNKFMSVNPDDDSVVAQNMTAGEMEFCTIRSSKTREVNTVVLPDEEQGNLNEVEVNYVADTTEDQLSQLVEYMCENPEFGREYVTEGTLHSPHSAAHWVRLKETLANYGPDKSVDQWKEIWEKLIDEAKGEGRPAWKAECYTGTPLPVSERTDDILSMLGYCCVFGIYGVKMGNDGPEDDHGYTPPNEVKTPPKEVKTPPKEVKTPPKEVKTPPKEVKSPPKSRRVPSEAARKMFREATLKALLRNNQLKREIAELYQHHKNLLRSTQQGIRQIERSFKLSRL